MTYCLNPSCPKPINHPKAKVCRACGSKLLLRDRYHLVKGLGKGGFGATFLAADISLPGNPLCVIKQLRPNTENPQFLSMARQLFEREAKTLGKIGKHPQIPRLLDYFEDRQQFYLVQEFVKGNTLQQEVKKKGVFNEAQVRQVLQEIAAILKDIHAQKVIHRDIKPANIIRRELDQKLVLIDFGVVKNQVNTVAAGNSEQTALTAFAVGTPGFAPPEQLAMRPVYASDVYALGITCMYLMTGKAPKNMECDPITGEIDWFKNLDVSDHFVEMLTTMLEIAVKNRYKTADEVLQALDMEDHLDSLTDSMIIPSTGSNSAHSGLRNTAFSSQKTTRFNSRLGERNSARRTNTSSTSSRNRLSSRGSDWQSQRAKRDRTRTSRTQISRNSVANNNSRRTNSVGRGNSTEPKKPIKLDKEALLNAYSSGRKDFGQKDISWQDLQKVDLSEANFNKSKLVKVNLQGAKLKSTNFSETDMRQTNLRGAYLCRAYFISANLEGADLRGADLSFVRFDNANLKGANLCGANLTNASISKEQIEQVKTNWTTILPSGRRGFW